MESPRHREDGGERSGRGAPPRASSRSAGDQLVPEVYDELRRMAHRQLRGERADHTLGTTALVHEAWLKLAGLERIEWRSRAHYCAEAARAMRRVLVDYAERRRAKKRGGSRVRVELDDALAMTRAEAGRLLDLHSALEVLETTRPRQARVVECRFFAGMSVEEIAQALDISPATVKRDWTVARAWLHRELDGGAEP